MAYATVINSNTTNSAGSGSLVLNMPASIVAGRLLVNVATVAANDSATTAMSGWNKIASAQRSSGTGTMTVFGKVAAGGDTGTVTGTSAARGNITYQVDGWSGTLADVLASVLGGTLSSLDPPSLTMPSSDEHLWIAGCRTNGTQTPTAPSGYSGTLSSINGNHRTVTAQRNATAATENPGAFTGGAGNALACTIGIPPAAAAAPNDFFPAGMLHHEDELTRRRSGLLVPRERELVVCRAA